MKKFNQIKVKFLAMAALAMFANVATAQSLKVTRGGEPVANGDVVEVKWICEEESFPELDLYSYYYTWNPHLEVATDVESASLTVTVTSIDNTTGFQFCWPDGCLDPEPGKSVSSTSTIGLQPQDLNIHKEVAFDSPTEKPTDGGSLRVRMVCGGETVEVTVKALLEGDTGVGSVSTDEVATYYTLQGLRIDHPKKGQLYIERKGGKATKRVF